LPAIEKRIMSASVLTGGKVNYSQSPQGIELRVPAKSRQDIDTVLQLRLDGPASEVAPR